MTRLILIFLFMPLLAFSQPCPGSQSGFFWGLAAGPSVYSVTATGLAGQDGLSFTLPNLKAGYFLTEATALAVIIPGTVYPYRGPGRSRDRIFEGVIPAVHHQLRPDVWVEAGAGLSLDAMTFYDTRSREEIRIYTGPSWLAAAGLDIGHWRSATVDIQVRYHGGMSRIPGGTRHLHTLDLMAGLTWY